jgi:hypothetical protein
MSLSLTKLFIGRRVAKREADERKLGVLTGVPAMGLGGLGSASYGPRGGTHHSGGHRRSRSWRRRAGHLGDPGAARDPVLLLPDHDRIKLIQS